MPCPERKDSQLSKVHPSLYHTLYRAIQIRKSRSSRRMLIILHSGKTGSILCSMDLCSASVLMRHLRHSRLELYAAVEQDEIYLYDTLGRKLQTDVDGNYLYGDRIFKMSGNRIENIQTAPHEAGGVLYYLKEQENGKGQAIFCNKGGNEVLFESMGKSIDSFCIVGDWIYYSAWMKGKERGKQHSQLIPYFHDGRGCRGRRTA